MQTLFCIWIIGCVAVFIYGVVFIVCDCTQCSYKNDFDRFLLYLVVVFVGSFVLFLLLRVFCSTSQRVTEITGDDRGGSHLSGRCWLCRGSESWGCPLQSTGWVQWVFILSSYDSLDTFWVCLCIVHIPGCYTECNTFDGTVVKAHSLLII